MFQFTLPRGERLVIGHATPYSDGFNSRSRVGSDRPPPTTTATPSSFQFTLPRGERHSSAAASVLEEAFQFTLPRGERPEFPLRCLRAELCFNSRSRVGSDSSYCQEVLRQRVSIHAPAWGATCVTGLTIIDCEFQFTLPRGERLNFYNRKPPRMGFNSRSRVGSDSNYLGLPALPRRFNSRSRVGSDP